MSKKKIYPVQIAISYSSPCFLPYSMGCIAAYLKNDTEIMQEYEICDVTVMRETIPDIIKRFDNPYIVAFTNFVWNLEYNKALAKELKKLYPEVKIIFGGHSVPPDASFLEKYDFIDYLMHNEGEETFSLLLKALASGEDLNSVPNLSFRSGEEYVTTAEYHPADISSYPSPYTEGIFDHLLEEFPDIEFHATLETNRGCPYACAYCEWCFTRRIREFPIEKIKAEIEWIAKNKIRYCYCADANFGILERDVEIAEYVAKQSKIHGYPEVFKPCYAKESDDTVFEAGYILNSNHIDKGVTLAYQTLDPVALENIGRKNLTLEHFSDLYARYSEAGIPTYTELILGLPGETCESFCKGICSLLESGQSNSMTVYECQVYDNSRMGNPEYRQKHGIGISRIPSFGIHYNPDFSGVQEYMDVITETATMSKDEWVRAYMFSVVLQTFHHLGLTRYFAVYLNKEKNISYYEFYSRLFNYIYDECTGFIHRLFVDLYNRKADTNTADWTYLKEEFGSTGWYFEEGAFLEIASHIEEFPKDLKPFLEKFGIEDSLFDDLFNYQKSLVRLVGTTGVKLELRHNFYPYFKALEEGEYIELRSVKNTLSIKAHKVVDTWKDYAREFVWFGKRYSATLLVNPREHIEYIEE
ncbi:MAG: cobalamin-dependent protein [Clostridia bacterium]|nr:cobalamin-dependent protein [Clostridia bacterium]